MAKANFPEHPVSTKDAARFLNVKASDLEADIRARRIPAITCGGTTLVHVPTVAAWLANRAARSLPVRTLADMLADLRSDDLSARIRGMVDMARAIGAGMRLQGVSEFDVEFGIGKDLSILLERAALGDTAAVDRLEAIVTNKPCEAQSTPREPSAAARAATRRSE